MDEELSLAHGVVEESRRGSDPQSSQGTNTGGDESVQGQSAETEEIPTKARGHRKKGAKGHGKKAKGVGSQTKSQQPPPEFAKEIRAWAERLQKRIEKRKFKLKLDFSAFKKLFRRRKKKKNISKADQSTFATQTTDCASTGEDLDDREERRQAMEVLEKLLRDLMKGMPVEDLRYTSTSSLCSRSVSGDTLESNPGLETLRRRTGTSSASVSTPSSQQSTMTRAMDPRSMQRAALTYLLMKLSRDTNPSGDTVGETHSTGLSQDASGSKANDDDLERWCWEFLKNEGEAFDSSGSDDDDDDDNDSDDECRIDGDAMDCAGGSSELAAMRKPDEHLRRRSCSDVANLKPRKMRGKRHLRAEINNSKYSSLQEFPNDELDADHRHEELKSAARSGMQTVGSGAVSDSLDGIDTTGQGNSTTRGQEAHANQISNGKRKESTKEQNSRSGLSAAPVSNAELRTRGELLDSHPGHRSSSSCGGTSGSKLFDFLSRRRPRDRNQSHTVTGGANDDNTKGHIEADSREAPAIGETGAGGATLAEVNETLPSSGKCNKSGDDPTEYTPHSTVEGVMACQNRANDGGNLCDEQRGSRSVSETGEEYSSETHLVNNENGEFESDVDVDSETISVGDGYVSVEQGSVIDSSVKRKLYLSGGQSPNDSEIVCHTTNVRTETHSSRSIERESHYYTSTENIDNKTHVRDQSNVQDLLNAGASIIAEYSPSSELCPSENNFLISSSADSRSDVVDFTAQNMESELKPNIGIEENGHRSDAEEHDYLENKHGFSYDGKQYYTDRNFKVTRNSANIEHTPTGEIVSLDNDGHGEQPTASYVEDIQQEHNEGDLALGGGNRTYDHAGSPVDTTPSEVPSLDESTLNGIVKTRGHESDAFAPPVAGAAREDEDKLDGYRSPRGSESSEDAQSETESAAYSTDVAEEGRWEAGVSALQRDQREESVGTPTGSRLCPHAKAKPLGRLKGDAAYTLRASPEFDSEESLFSHRSVQRVAAVGQGCLHDSKTLAVVDLGTQTASDLDSTSPGARSTLSTDGSGLFQVSPLGSEHWETLGPVKTTATSAATQTIWLSHAECQTYHAEDLPGATGEAVAGSRSSNLGRGVCWFIPADRVSNIHGIFTADGERLSHQNGPIPTGNRRPVGPYMVISPKDALVLRRPDFISRSSERQRWVSHLAEERQTERLTLRRRQQQLELEQRIQRHGRRAGDHITSRQRKCHHPGEITANPRKKHERLPDVKRQRQTEEREKFHHTSHHEYADSMPKTLSIQTSWEKM